MPKIRFLEILCRCGQAYRFSLDRILRDEPFECPACSENHSMEHLRDSLNHINSYNQIICEMEKQFEIKEDVLMLKRQKKSFITVAGERVFK